MPTLFFSYSHKDEKLRDQLEVHLAMLKREGVIEAWHDRKIPVGDEIDSSIDDQLESAAVILLLVSSDFLASSYCYDQEVRRAMERHEERTARVIPVILRPCDWKKAPFGRLLAAPEDGKPVTKWAHRDEAFLDVVQRIRAALVKLEGAGAEPKEIPEHGHGISGHEEDIGRLRERRDTREVSGRAERPYNVPYSQASSRTETTGSTVISKWVLLSATVLTIVAGTVTLRLAKDGRDNSASPMSKHLSPITAPPTGFFSLQSKASELFLEVSQEGPEKGFLIQSAYTGKENQIWTTLPTDTEGV